MTLIPGRKPGVDVKTLDGFPNDPTQFLRGDRTFAAPPAGGGGGGGSGDVVGPAASTNNHVAAFNGATGKLLKDAGVLVADVVVTTDTRLSDARTPTAHTHPESDVVNLVSDLSALATGVAAAEQLAHKNAASGYAGLDASSKLTGSQQKYGSAANTAAEGNDTRLSDARTPTAHKTSHQDGGSDELSVTGLSGVLADPQPPIIGAGATQAVAGNDARLSGAWTVISNADTGAQNNWAPAGLLRNTLIEWNGAADIAPTGLAGGVAGQLVMIKNVTTTKIATFPHLSGSSSAANQFTNHATVGLTPIAAGGFITYQHNGTNWKIIGHEQGAWITPTYAAGTYVPDAGTWTVDSGDVIAHKSRLSGRSLTFAVRIDTSSVASSPFDLRTTLPFGLKAAATTQDDALVFDNVATSTDVGVAAVISGNTYVSTFLKTFGAWATSTNLTYIRFTLTFEVQ